MAFDLDQAVHNATSRVQLLITTRVAQHQLQLQKEFAGARQRAHGRHFHMRRDLGLSAFVPSYPRTSLLNSFNSFNKD